VIAITPPFVVVIVAFERSSPSAEAILGAIGKVPLNCRDHGGRHMINLDHDDLREWAEWLVARPVIPVRRRVYH
jgi:hypothetical protein